ncbi:MAG: HNH endonuclease signature motif containing protein [Alphaproteobacteria bacterium]
MTSQRRLRAARQRVGALDTRTASAGPKRVDPFYASREWRTLMDAVIAARGRRCERCGRADGRIFGDHVVELKDGGAALDARNVQLLCGACHSAKTAAERAARTKTRAESMG